MTTNRSDEGRGGEPGLSRGDLVEHADEHVRWHYDPEYSIGIVYQIDHLDPNNDVVRVFWPHRHHSSDSPIVGHWISQVRKIK